MNGSIERAAISLADRVGPGIRTAILAQPDGILSAPAPAPVAGDIRSWDGIAGMPVLLASTASNCDTVRLLKTYGVTRIILCLPGVWLTRREPGCVGLVVDHLNLTGRNPLIGPNDDSFGPRFPDMTEPYSEYLRSQTDLEWLRPVVAADVPDVSALTAANKGTLVQLGADVAAEQLAAPVICSRHAGLEVSAIVYSTDTSRARVISVLAELARA